MHAAKRVSDRRRAEVSDVEGLSNVGGREVQNNGLSCALITLSVGIARECKGGDCRGLCGIGETEVQVTADGFHGGE